MKTKILTVIFLIINVMLLPAQEVLDNIEQQILAAYGQSVQTQSDQFLPIIQKLERAYQKEQDQMVNYWLAFARYRGSIWQMSNTEDGEAFDLLKKGITQLEDLEKPTSEDLALLGSMISISINFQPAKAALLSAEAGKHFEKAVKMEGQNLRGYLGIGRSDYYKPKQYGGGLKVESYLKKALAQPDASGNDSHTPTWGRDEAYYYLASFYHREGRNDEAKLYVNKGLKDCPDYYLLQVLQGKLQ